MNVLQLGQLTSAEHDLGVSSSEVLRVHSDAEECLVGGGLVVRATISEDLWRHDRVTHQEVRVHHLVGQTQLANTDALQHSVASELMHDQGRIGVTRLLDLVGDDATHEVRMSRVQVVHQLHQRLTMAGRNGHHGRTLLLLSGVLLLEDDVDDDVGGFLHHGDDGLIDGILVLEEPASDVVADDSGIVAQLEVSFGLALLCRLWLAEFVVLAQVLAHELLQVGFVGSLGDDALFLQHGEDAHLLLDQLDGGQQVHAEVDEGPLDTLSLVLFLLLDEHVVVEELLETLVGVVDQKLLEGVELENLETGDIQHTNEGLSWIGRVQRVVDKTHDPIKETSVQRLGSSGDGESDLVLVLSLFDVVLADLQLGLHEGVDEEVGIGADQLSRFRHFLHAVRLSLLLTTLLFPLGISEVAEGDGGFVKTLFVVLRETENIKSLIGGLHLLFVIHASDGEHTLGDEEVISRVGVLAQEAHVVVGRVVGAHELVEDVVVTLNFQLEGDTGLLQKVGLDIGGGDFVGGAEVNTDELTEAGRVVVSDGLGVTVGLQRRVSLDNLLLKGTGVGTLGGLGLGGLGIGTVQGVVLQDLLGVLGLSSSGLASDQRRLMLVLHLQELEGAVSDGVQVGRGFIPSLVAVIISHDLSVHHQPLVRVDADAEKTGVGVDLEHLVARAKIVQNASSVKNRQVGHVFFLLEFRRVAFQNLGFGKGDGRSLVGFEIDLVSAASGNLGSDVDVSRIGNPSVSLGIEGCGALLHELFLGGFEPNPIWMLRTQFLRLRHFEPPVFVTNKKRRKKLWGWLW